MVAPVGDAGADVVHTGESMKKLIAIALFALGSLNAFAKVSFVEDDYAKAVAQAKKKNVPIFVEAWAPW